jgi:L-rhamnose mutarotase
VIVALHSEIREGAVDAYRDAHTTIPDDLAATFARIGITDWSIWRSGRHLFHLVECDDWDAATTALATDPANAAWQATIGRYVETFRGPDGEEAVAALETVWQLREQLR